MENLAPGTVVRMRSISTVGPDGKATAKYRSPNGEVFVFVLLGVESANIDKGKGQLDVEQALQNMGWGRWDEA